MEQLLGYIIYCIAYAVLRLVGVKAPSWRARNITSMVVFFVSLVTAVAYLARPIP